MYLKGRSNLSVFTLPWSSCKEKESNWNETNLPDKHFADLHQFLHQFQLDHLILHLDSTVFHSEGGQPYGLLVEARCFG
jgi:hypothetical protein